MPAKTGSPESFRSQLQPAQIWTQNEITWQPRGRHIEQCPEGFSCASVERDSGKPSCFAQTVFARKLPIMLLMLTTSYTIRHLRKGPLSRNNTLDNFPRRIPSRYMNAPHATMSETDPAQTAIHGAKSFATQHDNFSTYATTVSTANTTDTRSIALFRTRVIAFQDVEMWTLRPPREGLKYSAFHNHLGQHTSCPDSKEPTTAPARRRRLPGPFYSGPAHYDPPPKTRCGLSVRRVWHPAAPKKRAHRSSRESLDSFHRPPFTHRRMHDHKNS